MSDERLAGRRQYELGRLPFVLLTIVLLLFLDQLTKAWAISVLRESGPFVLFPGILEFLYTENTGAAFGILKGQQWFFYIAACFVTVLLTVWILRLPKGRRSLPLMLDLMLIIAGALGNVIDRLRFGYVVDFIYFKPIDFPVFNVADIYITCGCAVLVLLMLFYDKDNELRV